MKIRVVDQLYLMCVSLGIIFTSISLTSFAAHESVITMVTNYLLLVLCIIQLVRTFYLMRKKGKWLMLWCLCMILLFIGYRTVDDRTLLDAFAYGTGAVFVDYKRIAKTMRLTWIWCLVITALLSFLHIIPTVSTARNTGRMRMSLGFVHPNTLGFILFIIGLLLFVDSYDKRSKNSFVVLLLLTITDFYVADSRTTTILLLIMDVVMAGKVFKNNIIGYFLKKKWVRNLLLIFVIALIGASAWAAISYNGIGRLLQLNGLLNNRVQNGAYYMSLYGISLFGKNIPEFVLWSDNFTRLYLDNGYLLMLIKYGVIATAVYIMMILLSARKAIKAKDIAMIVAIGLIAISLLTEQSALRWCFCPILMYMCAKDCNRVNS
jgi:hypothetical protein